MTGDFAALLKKFSIPFLLTTTGLVMVLVGFAKNQDSVFLTSSFLMLAAGLLSLLYSSGKLKSQMVTILGFVAGIAALISIYISYDSVAKTNEYNKNYAYCKAISKQNLEDVRYIQKVYAEQNGKYIDNWDGVVQFVHEGKVPYVEAEGVVPSRRVTVEENKYLYPNNPPIDNNMSDIEAYRLSKWTEGPNYAEFAGFKRDTIQVSILDFKFRSRSYRENRAKMGFYPFNADSLGKIPFTNDMWLIETVDSLKVKGTDIVGPALKISGKIPFASVQGKNNDTEEIFMGSLKTHDLDGSWEAE